MNHKEQYIAFDLLRGVAALLVCAGHLRNLLFADYGKTVSPSALDAAFYLATGVGHPAVIVFFVLSGFFVGGSVWGQARRGEFKWNDYLIARLSRLWTVLMPAMLLTVVFDTAGKAISTHAGYEGLSLSWGTVLGNAFFLQTIAVPVLGSNGPLWSLANEFWYYMLFPFVALASQRLYGRSIYYVAIASGVLVLLPPDMSLGFLYWLVGWLASLTVRSDVRLGWWHVAIGVTVFVVSLASTKFLAGHAGELFVAVSTWLLLHVLPAIRLAGLPGQITRGLAEMSYSLYLFHFPFMTFLWFVFISPEKSQPSFIAYMQFLVFFIVTLIFCFAMWWLFERHTMRLRSFLRSGLQSSIQYVWNWNRK